MGKHDPLIAKCRAARILKFLVRNGICTVRQIANYIGNITENRLYHVLKVMRNEGLVVEMGWTLGLGYSKGRSRKLYKAAEDNHKVMELVQFLER